MGVGLKEIIENLRLLSAEIEARAGSTFWCYRPHEKQAEFHTCSAKCRFVFGGNRTGKSECGAVETVRRAVGLTPYANRPLPLEVLHDTHKTPPAAGKEHGVVVNTPNRGLAGFGDCWVVSLTRQVQRDVAQAKILKYLPKSWIVQIVMTDGASAAAEYGVIDFIIVKNRGGGVSKIGFRNCEQGRERFQGVGLDFIWFDEEPPEDIYDECLLRLLDRGGVHFATMTPLKGRSWVFDRIYLAADANPNIRLFSMSWADNPHLNAAEIAGMESTLSPAVLESRKFGRFVDSGGLVYPEFTDANIVEPFAVAEMQYKYIAIDTGWTDPTAVLWGARDAVGNVYIVRDYELPRQTAEIHSAEIKRITADLGWDMVDVKILMDSAATQRTAGSPVSVAEQYRALGLPADTNVIKSIFAGVMAVKAEFCDCAGMRRLYVFRSCGNLIRELRGYFWGDGDKPRGGADHTLDALRYLIMHIKNEKPAAGVLGAAKKQFIKKLRRSNG